MANTNKIAKVHPDMVLEDISEDSDIVPPPKKKALMAVRKNKSETGLVVKKKRTRVIMAGDSDITADDVGDIPLSQNIKPPPKW